MRTRDVKTFGATLDSIQDPPESPGRSDEAAFALPTANLSPPWGPSAERGVGSLWDHAQAWVPDPEAPETSPPIPPRSIDIESIGSELNLKGLSTVGELHRARRRFMWENHPDRYPELHASLANRRAAIANMLVDRALEALSGRGK